MPALLNQTLAFATLREAWQRVRDNQGCAGTDGETLKRFDADLEINLAALRNEALQRSYAPRPLLSVVVESAGKKPRRLAVAIVLTPLLEAEFEECSFAYRRGRSVDLAVRRIMQYRDQGFRWVVDGDIASFFAEIDHQRLVREVAELVQDVGIMDLITLWLKAPITDGETTWRPTRRVSPWARRSRRCSQIFIWITWTRPCWGKSCAWFASRMIF